MTDAGWSGSVAGAVLLPTLLALLVSTAVAAVLLGVGPGLRRWRSPRAVASVAALALVVANAASMAADLGRSTGPGRPPTPSVSALEPAQPRDRIVPTVTSGPAISAAQRRAARPPRPQLTGAESAPARGPVLVAAAPPALVAPANPVPAAAPVPATEPQRDAAPQPPQPAAPSVVQPDRPSDDAPSTSSDDDDRFVSPRAVGGGNEDEPDADAKMQKHRSGGDPRHDGRHEPLPHKAAEADPSRGSSGR